MSSGFLGTLQAKHLVTPWVLPQTSRCLAVDIRPIMHLLWKFSVRLGLGDGRPIKNHRRVHGKLMKRHLVLALLTSALLLPAFGDDKSSITPAKDANGRTVFVNDESSPKQRNSAAA